MAQDTNHQTQADPAQPENTAGAAADPKPHAPYRRTGFLLLILCALPIPFLSSFMPAETTARISSVLADVGLLLFVLFFGLGEWKAGRTKMALLVLVFMVMALFGFALHCRIIFA